MASMDAATLEFFVSDAFMNLTPDQEAQIVEALEPAREYIEYKLGEDYDPDEHAWRDYRNSLWAYGLEDYHSVVQAILSLRPYGANCSSSVTTPCASR